MDLTGKVALVTGAGQYVGLGIAKQLAADGATVLINDIHADRAAEGVAALEATGGKAAACVFDVTSLESVAAALAALPAELANVDILVNNAGNAGARDMPQVAFKDMPTEHWDWYLGVNLMGVLNWTKAVINGMTDRGWGRIITISSEAGRAGLNINVSIYGAAKAGAAHFMRHLSHEVGPLGVTANTVSLGLMNNVPDEFSGPMIKTIPTRRLGSPEDVGDAVSYLAGADWVSGQTIVVNGGSQAF